MHLIKTSARWVSCDQVDYSIMIQQIFHHIHTHTQATVHTQEVSAIFVCNLCYHISEMVHMISLATFT